MANKIFIDTSFVIALINQNDQYHAIAIDLSDKFNKAPLVTTNGVLLEIGSALAKKYKAESIKIIEYFMASSDVEVINLTPSLFDQSFDLYKKYQDKEWSLIDCCSFVVMERIGIKESLTSDKHFSQAGYKILLKE